MTEEAGDFDPTRAAAIATGRTDPDAPGAGAENHADVEGAEGGEDVGGGDTWKEMLFRSKPSPSLDSIDDPWAPDRGGPTRIYRGIMKMADVDGMPAIGDVAIGLCEVLHELKGKLPSDDDGGGSSSGNDGIPLAEAE